MQEIKKRVVESRMVSKYIAEDGKEFDNSLACEIYETALFRQRANEQVEFCRELDDHPPCYGNEDYDSREYRWYKPKNREDVQILKAAYEDGLFSDSDIGRWICVELTTYGRCRSTALNDCMEYLNKILVPLGYEMTVQKRQEKGEFLNGKAA